MIYFFVFVFSFPSAFPRARFPPDNSIGQLRDIKRDSSPYFTLSPSRQLLFLVSLLLTLWFIAGKHDRVSPLLLL